MPQRAQWFSLREGMMIIAVELDRARRELLKYINALDDDRIVYGKDLARVDAILKEVMDELERRENPSGRGKQG